MHRASVKDEKLKVSRQECARMIRLSTTSYMNAECRRPVVSS